MRFTSLSLVLSLLAGTAAAQDVTTLDLSSVAPTNLPLIGTAPVDFAETVAAISGGALDITVHEPGALVPPLEIFDAVSSGAVEAGWAPAAFWSGKMAAAPLFTAIPFGPGASEYLGWMRHGGGDEIWTELMEARDVHPVVCAITPPEASGWFRDEIASLDDLNGLKMRFLGLGARVMERFGVSTQLIAPPDIFTSLQLGTIDAAEFSMPAIDLKLGFYQIAKHYYFPGWHQPYTLVNLIVHKPKWDSLSDAEKAQIETACGDRLHRDLAAGEAAQVAALEDLEELGVTLHRWPEQTLEAFEAAWAEVADEQAAADADFARAWNSLSTFRERFAKWKELGHVN